MDIDTRFSPLPFTFLFLALLPLLIPPWATGAETAIVEVVLNGEPRGEYFINLTEKGDVLMSSADLIALSIPLPPGNVVQIDGIPHRSLRAMEEVDFTLDQKTLSLLLTVDPDLLPRRTIDFSVERKQKVFFPRESSLFLNYAVDYLDFGPGQKGVNLSNQLGVRRGNGLFLTDSTYRGADVQARFVRLMTSLITESRESLTRWTVGDFFASSSELGGNVNLGGISFAKRFEINPYLLRYPNLSFAGVVPTPSEVEIYLDGAKLRKEHLSPGPFELANITRHGGAGLLELVIKDPFDNEQRLLHPFYLAENLLKKGLHEYSYNLGVQRENFGAESLSYGDPALSAFHRYGYTNEITLGLSGEAGPGLYNLGGEASWSPGTAGVFKGELAGHVGENGGGFAGLLRYSYLGHRASARLGLAHYSLNFANLSTADQNARPKYSFTGATSFGSRRFGSLSFELAASADHAGGERRSAALSYSRSLPFDLNLFAIFRRGWEDGESDDTVLLSLNYHPWADVQVSGRIETRRESDTLSVQALKNPPLGEGYGYQFALERNRGSEATTNDLGVFAQYNGRYGIYRSDLQFSTGSEKSNPKYRLSASGALARIGGATALTRPITDSFGVVKVGDLEGVRVMHNGQDLGKTDKEGLVFLPNLSSYYENQITINDKDIPLDYSLNDVTRFVSPPLRSGSCIPFRAVRFQPLVGSLYLANNGKLAPLEFREAEFSFQGLSARIPTGKGGEFYLDPSETAESGKQESSEDGCAWLTKPARKERRLAELHGRIEYEGRIYTFEVDVPEARDFFVDLGKIVVNASAVPPSPAERLQ